MELISTECEFEDNRDQDGRDFISYLKVHSYPTLRASIDGYIRDNKANSTSGGFPEFCRDANDFFKWLNLRKVNVKHVNLVSWKNVSDEAMRELGEICSRLESLIIFDSTITDQGIGLLADGCSILQTLMLHSCGNVTDKGLSKLSQGCGMLRKLDLTHCRNITNIGLKSLANNCSALQDLDLIFCRNITDNDGLRHLNEYPVPLQSLNLTGCKIRNGDLAHLRHRPLQYLNLTYCENITNLDELDGGLAVQYLQTLDLGKCPNVSNTNLWSFAKMCSNLETLILDDVDCSNFESLTEVVDSLWQVET
jgi:hypothetical protein